MYHLDYTHSLNFDDSSVIHHTWRLRNLDCCLYYYFTASYGDWGLSDEIKLHKATIFINKQSGRFYSIENEIRQVSGKTNDY